MGREVGEDRAHCSIRRPKVMRANSRPLQAAPPSPSRVSIDSLTPLSSVRAVTVIVGRGSIAFAFFTPAFSNLRNIDPDGEARSSRPRGVSGQARDFYKTIRSLRAGAVHRRVSEVASRFIGTSRIERYMPPFRRALAAITPRSLMSFT